MAIKRNGTTTGVKSGKEKFMANSVIKVPVKIEKSKWILTTGIDIKDNEFIRGTIIKREKVDENIVQSVRNFNWKVGLYPDLALSKNLVITTYFDDDTKEVERVEPSIEADEVMAAAIQDRILEVIENDPTRPIYKLITSSPFYSVEGEVAAASETKDTTPEVEDTKEDTKEPANEEVKEIKLSKEAINFMKSNKVKGKEAINLSVKLLEEANAEIAKLKAELSASSSSNAVNVETVIENIYSLTEEERSEVVYEFIPAEYVEAFDKVNALPEEDTTPAMEDDTDLTPDPEDKMPIPQPSFDVEELKAQLKAEIMSELREELKASLSVSAKEIATAASETKTDTKEVKDNKEVKEVKPNTVANDTKKDTKPSLAAIRQMNANAINTDADDITWDSDDNGDTDLDIEFDDANDTKPAANTEQKFADAQERIKRSAAEIRKARKAARAASASK